MVEIKCRCKDCRHSRKPDSKWALFRHCYLLAGRPELDPEKYPIVEDNDFCSRGEKNRIGEGILKDMVIMSFRECSNCKAVFSIDLETEEEICPFCKSRTVHPYNPCDCSCCKAKEKGNLDG